MIDLQMKNLQMKKLRHGEVKDRDGFRRSPRCHVGFFTNIHPSLRRQCASLRL